MGSSWTRQLGWASGAAACGLFAASLCLADATSAADTIKARQDHMHDLGGAMKAIGDQLKSPTPDMAVIKAAAQKVADASAALPSWFPAGSGPDSGVKTHAKAEIWSDPTGFSAAASNFAAEAAKLNTAASGSADDVKAEVPSVGEACGACHMKYREKPPAPPAPPPAAPAS